MSEEELRTIPGSSPVYGNLLEQAVKLVGRPPRGETSLQKYGGTNVYQWHYRESVYWHPWGQLMFLSLQAHTATVAAEAAGEARLKAIFECLEIYKQTGKLELKEANLNTTQAEEEA